jgi:hypothetical protein
VIGAGSPSRTAGGGPWVIRNFALKNGDVRMVLLDQLAAAAVKTLIDAADKVNWSGKTLDPGSTAH